MKTTLLLLTIAGSFVLPAVIHADPQPAKAKQSKATATHPAAKVAAAKPHETTYISKDTATGSHIPTVWRAYEGRMDTPSNIRVYSQGDLSRSGQLDVANELTFTDPSITTGRGR